MMTVQQIQAGLVYVALAVVAVFVMIAVVDVWRSTRRYGLALQVAAVLIGLLVIALFYLLALLVLATQVYHTA